MELSPSDIIQIIGILVSLFTSTIAIIISVKTVIQNSKMIEESTRAVICIYGDSINPGSPMFYLIVKNCGHSLATITKFDTDFDFTDCYGFRTDRNFVEDLSCCTIAPGQSRICRLEYSKITRPITFHIEYLSATKKYVESYTVDLKSGSNMLVSKVSTKDKELSTISYTLQEILQKNL